MIFVIFISTCYFHFLLPLFYTAWPSLASPPLPPSKYSLQCCWFSKANLSIQVTSFFLTLFSLIHVTLFYILLLKLWRDKRMPPVRDWGLRIDSKSQLKWTWSTLHNRVILSPCGRFPRKQTKNMSTKHPPFWYLSLRGQFDRTITAFLSLPATNTFSAPILVWSTKVAPQMSPLGMTLFPLNV